MRKPKSKKRVWRIVHMYDESSRVRQLGVAFPRNGGGKGFAALNIDMIESPKRLRTALVQEGAKLSGSIKEQIKFIAGLL